MNQWDHDARSLALHHLVAEKMRANPKLMLEAHAVLDHWFEVGPVDARPYFEQWRQILDQGLEHTIAVACEDSEQATALRQSSPLSVLLSNEERLAFFAEWKRAHRPSPAPDWTKKR